MENQTKTMSIVAFICGLLGIIFTFVLPILGLILAILALVFASIAKKKEGPSGLRTAGFVLAIVALAIWIIYVVIIGIVVGAAFGAIGAAAAFL